MIGSYQQRGLWLDPRTKIVLLRLCVLSAMSAPSLRYELGLVVLIGVFGVCCGRWKYAIKGMIFYGLIYLFTVWAMGNMTGTLRTTFIAFLGLFHKVYPCGMLSGIVLSTTKVSEFLSAMNRIHAPKKLVIPLAVYQGRQETAGRVTILKGPHYKSGHDRRLYLCSPDDGSIQSGR